MMARRLIHDDNREEFGWSCGSCGKTWANASFGGAGRAAFRAARECCTLRVCECGKLCRSVGWTICGACRAHKEREQDLESFRKAKKVPRAEYAGDYVCFGDDRYADPDDDDEWLDRAEMTDGIRWAWACEPDELSLSAEDILHQALEEHHEGAIESVDVEALQRALDEWLKANPVTSYHATHKVVVTWDGED